MRNPLRKRRRVEALVRAEKALAQAREQRQRVERALSETGIKSIT